MAFASSLDQAGPIARTVRDCAILLGSMALGQEAATSSYGLNPDRDLVAELERIGEARWRLVIPWPRNESNLDLIELRPAN